VLAILAETVRKNVLAIDNDKWSIEGILQKIFK
jgi:hypothetical protein